ncbi:MAG: cbb3-type cytochrome c oxidase subunit I [Mariprofundaceae bacterium]|nr:cbb3-type cytochrome c oxidase subunit I [Mariprofundaceae bacterium]
MPVQNDYRFDASELTCQRLAGGWLKLAVTTLFIAGIYAALLAVARTPLLKDIVPSDDFFYTSLVIHVIFSNVFWFLAIAGSLWSLNTRGRFIPLGWAALFVAAAGVAVIALSPFIGAGNPVMANYIPFLNSPLFFAGLTISGIGFALLVIRTLAAAPKFMLRRPEGSMRFGTFVSANAAAMAILAFFWAFFTMPEATPDKDLYEGLFWLGGHVLQFTHSLLMLVAWMWLASASGVHLKLSPRVATLLFTLALLTVASTPIAFLTENVASIDFQLWFTTQMQIGGAVATVPLGLAVLVSLFWAGKAAPEVQPLRIALLLSMLLFAVGGGLGYFLRESSTLVTAHYHSVTGAVTLAFMALVYNLLPHLGFGAVPRRLAGMQVYAYGIGQLLHVLGLAWAGGYGMARKVGGSGQSLDNIGQTLGMSLMGLGSLIATIGGLLFLVAVINAMRRHGHG